jgi:hypothetical protein
LPLFFAGAFGLTAFSEPGALFPPDFKTGAAEVALALGELALAELDLSELDLEAVAPDARAPVGGTAFAATFFAAAPLVALAAPALPPTFAAALAATLPLAGLVPPDAAVRPRPTEAADALVPFAADPLLLAAPFEPGLDGTDPAARTLFGFEFALGATAAFFTGEVADGARATLALRAFATLLEDLPGTPAVLTPVLTLVLTPDFDRAA